MNVLIEAISEKGHEMIWFDQRKNLCEIDFDSPNLVGFIVNTTTDNFIKYFRLSEENHWIAILKKEGIFYDLNSKLSLPKKFYDKNEVLDYLEYIRNNNGHLFIVQTIKYD